MRGCEAVDLGDDERGGFGEIADGGSGFERCFVPGPGVAHLFLDVALVILGFVGLANEGGRLQVSECSGWQLVVRVGGVVFVVVSFFEDLTEALDADEFGACGRGGADQA